MTAKHVQWSTHLVGVAQPLAQPDFPSLAREALRLRAAQESPESRFLADRGHCGSLPTTATMMPDESMVSAMIGKNSAMKTLEECLSQVMMARRRDPLCQKSGPPDV
jgi:hypothetical protein